MVRIPTGILPYKSAKEYVHLAEDAGWIFCQSTDEFWMMIIKAQFTKYWRFGTGTDYFVLTLYFHIAMCDECVSIVFANG